MKKVVSSLFTLGLLVAGTNVNAQIVGDNAFLIGDYIEIGIDSAGYEGTDSLPGSNNRYNTVSPHPEANFGFVANPAEDGWVEYNGDFFVPGTPENGWGITLDSIEYSNNAYASSFGPSYPVIDGTITDYTETVDSIYVTWEGTTPEIGVWMQWRLEKDDHFYTTAVSVENLTASSLDSVYFYRNLDPDHNQVIGWGFQTLNTIEAQGNDGGIARVSATQTDAWTAELIFEAAGSKWRATAGGFINRNGKYLWHGDHPEVFGNPYYQEVDSAAYADQAMALSYEIGTMGPGKSTGEQFEFVTIFKEGAGPGLSVEEEEKSSFEVYPNPSNGIFTIEAEGDYFYFVSDVKGKIHLQENGTGSTIVDLTTLPAGTYFVKLRQNGKFKTKPIIIH